MLLKMGIMQSVSRNSLGIYWLWFPGDNFGDGLMTIKEKPEVKPMKAILLMKIIFKHLG